MISKVREWLYKEKLLRSVDLPAFVVSVGNISLGGTGKSPFVALLAEWAVKQGIRTAVLSRGYGRKARDLQIVRPGETLPSADQIGDEPWMIKHRVPEISLLVHADRGRMAKRHWQELGAPDLVLLDDGFQHWRLVRDRDVVMLDASESLKGRLLPLGRLREGLGALGRADLVVVTRANGLTAESQQSILQTVRAQFAQPKVPLWKRSFGKPDVVLADYEFAEFRDLRTDLPVEIARGRECLLVAGIAKPDGFRQMAQQLGLNVKEEIYFPDHHRLSSADHQQILTALKSLRDGALVISEKDAARWRDFDMSAFVLCVHFGFFHDGCERLEKFFADLLSGVKRC